MRIEAPLEPAGMLVVALCGLVAAGLITGLLWRIEIYLFSGNKAARKVIFILMWTVWIVALALVALDLTGILPIYRHLLDLL